MVFKPLILNMLMLFCKTPNSTFLAWFSKLYIVCFHCNNANYFHYPLTHTMHIVVIVYVQQPLDTTRSFLSSSLHSTFYATKCHLPLFSKSLPIFKAPIKFSVLGNLWWLHEPSLCASVLNFSTMIISNTLHISTGTHTYCLQMFSIVADGFVQPSRLGDSLKKGTMLCK